jgi:hypothetical protein
MDVNWLYKYIGDALSLQGPDLFPRAIAVTSWSFAQQGKEEDEMQYGNYFRI